MPGYHVGRLTPGSPAGWRCQDRCSASLTTYAWAGAGRQRCARPARACLPVDDRNVPPRHLHQGDHRRRPRPQGTDDARARRPTALVLRGSAGARRRAPAARAARAAPLLPPPRGTLPLAQSPLGNAVPCAGDRPTRESGQRSCSLLVTEAKRALRPAFGDDHVSVLGSTPACFLATVPPRRRSATGSVSLRRPRGGTDAACTVQHPARSLRSGGAPVSAPVAPHFGWVWSRDGR